ncbi:MAG: glycosyltransferase family 39 protein [Candidatus Gottesmanbacteria bacterium]|nr:glycosyltransferase family 39 protein [Candidatus Gottesmanbacteria bacterium]
MKKQSRILHTLSFPLLVILTMWGILLRIIEIINGNYLFGFDQGRDYLAAYTIAVTHKLTLIGAEIGAGSAGISNIFHGPGYYYLIALMYALFHGDPYGGMVLMFLFGLGALILSYVTVNKMFGRIAALITLFLVGVSPLIASQSRFIWNSHPTSFFIVLVFYFAYCIGVKPRLYAPLAIFVAGLIYHFELAIAVPLVIALCVSLPVIYKIKDLRTYLYSFVALMIAFSPALVFEMRHGWQAVGSLWHYGISWASGSAGFSLARLTDHVQSFINNAINSFSIDGGILPVWIYKALCISLLISTVVFSKTAKTTAKRNFFSFLLLTLSISYFVLLFLNNTVWDYYLIHAHFAYMYVFAYAAAICISKLRTGIWYQAAAVILGIFMISMTLSSYKRVVMDYRYDLNDLGGVEKIKGKKIAIDYIYRDANGKPFSEFTFMAPIYTYPYDYLFKTYGRDTYGYVPGNEKKGLVYLIIEPDNSKPWTYKGWLETVIVGGKILQTTTLPTGHIVQKREFPI